MKKCLKVIELFAGVGGFRLGLEGWNGKSSISGYKKALKNKIPFKVVYSNQWEPASKRQHANEIYLERFGQDGHFDFSIDDLTNKYLKKNVTFWLEVFHVKIILLHQHLEIQKG
jgi:site-specific DNA-cytosine methylase